MLTNKDSEAIEALDLTLIKTKLMHVESGEGWTAARAAATEAQYRRFLYLMKKYPDEQISPTVDVDTFWHYHILDTRKYAEDCEQAFGYFLHHYPYVGIGEDAEPEDQARSGDRMHALYANEFGEPLHAAGSTSDTAWCAVTAPEAGVAWCAVTGKAAKTAWCAVTGTSTKTAWCAVAGKLAKMAWCAVTGKQPKMAWCAVTDEQPKLAWCAVTGKQAKTAWCAVTGKSTKMAWCAAAGKAGNVAWCASTVEAQRERAPANEALPVAA
jgi:hypothetical protein